MKNFKHHSDAYDFVSHEKHAIGRSGACGLGVALSKPSAFNLIRNCRPGHGHKNVTLITESQQVF